MNNRTKAILRDPAFQNAIRSTESIRSVAERWDVSFGFVQGARKKDGLPIAEKNPDDAQHQDGYSREESSDGKVVITKRVDRIIPLSEWLDDLRSDGLNPADYTTSHSHSVWMQHTAAGSTKTLYANKFSAVRKTAKEKAAELSTVDWEKAGAFVERFEYIPGRRDFLVDAAVLQPTDEQWGKTDFDGGTPETEERVMASYSAFVDYIREYRPRQVLLARTGDGIENFCSTSGQRDTNDLDLPAMIQQLFKMNLRSLAMIAPHAQSVIDASVPSNHGRWRTGPKADSGDAHADFGLSVAKQIQNTLEQTGFAPNVQISTPHPHMESMTVKLDTVSVGLVHGHQVNGPDRLGQWWSDQDHGRMPTWDADILLAGHFHSFRVQQSGDKRWIMVGPASDPGSSWFSNLKGERATSGMLAFAVEGKRWRFQEIL